MVPEAPWPRDRRLHRRACRQVRLVHLGRCRNAILYGPVLARAGRGSYATYLLHPVVLVSVMLAFRAVPLGAQLKFVVVSLVAVPVCFTVGYLATRLPGVGRVV